MLTKEELPDCPVATTVQLIGNKWKLLILRNLLACPSLKLAAENGCEGIAFCCISTGVFCFPADRAAEIAVETVLDELRQSAAVRRVIFNVFKDSDLKIYQSLLQ